ncbi:MAG: lipid-A-disaccharide synthase [bacterium]|nr:lipid-A-disaccharide synthase [bacterium]
MSKLIFISAGEPSGDLLAAGLVSAIKCRNSETTFKGMGGQALHASGCELLENIETVGSLMGFSELGPQLSRTFAALKRLKKALASSKPNLLILVDFGDFNLRLAKYAKSLGIPVLYFVTPKVWAWRKSRVNLLRKYVDLNCVIYPYEEQYLKDLKVKNVCYVGNPWADEIVERSSIQNFESLKSQFIRSQNLDPLRPTIAFFPGSRKGEVARHFKEGIKGLRLLRETHPEIQVIVSIAVGIPKTTITQMEIELGSDPSWIKFVSNASQEILKYSDCGLIKSGTSNIEAALSELPFVMFFKVSKVTEIIVRSAVSLKEYSPVNVLIPGTVKELLQSEFNPKKIKESIEDILFNNQGKEEMLRRFRLLREKLRIDQESSLSAYDRCAELALNTMKNYVNKKEIYRRVASYVRPYSKNFYVALFFMVFYGATDGALPILLKTVLDGVFQNHQLNLLYALTAIIICFTLLRAGADFGQQYLMSKVGHNVVKDIRNDINKHILKLSGGFFLNNSSANILSRITSDVVLVKTLLTDAAAAVLRDSIRIIALICAAIYLDANLAFIALIVLPIGIFPVYKFGRRMRKLSKKGQEAIGALSSVLNESIVGQKVVKAFGREDFEIQRFEQKNSELTSTFLKSEKVRAATGPVNEVLASFAIAGIIFYGGVSVINGIRTQGDFIAFLISVFLLYDPFKKLTRISSTIQQGLSGAERIFEILDTSPTILEPSEVKLLGNGNCIKLVNVNFSYNIDSREVLSGISLEVAEGRKVALVGLSGAGKSTLIDLIPRFIDPTNGIVTIGGINIKDVSISQLRSRIALVGQHTFLFNDTIYNNIKYGKEGASKEEIEEAAKAANAYDFIIRLKDGFNTLVGEGGYSLSGGERQRISIARAILKDAPILILDEATASLDNKAEREVQAGLDALQKNRTCVIIAHRLTTIHNADEILVMIDGKIIERGTHAELISQKGEYFKLYSLQFSSGNQDQGFGDERSIY